MFFEFIVLFSFVLISTFLLVNTHLKVKRDFKPINPTEQVSLGLMLENSNAYNFIPTSAKNRRIDFAQQQGIAGSNLNISADAAVKEASKSYCIDAHRTPQHEFDVESVDPGARE